MMQIQNISQLNSITDHDILNLVKLRHDQLGDEMFGSVIIVEADDSLSEIEKELGFPNLINLFDDRRYSDPDFIPSGLIRFKMSALNRFSLVTQK